MREKKRLYDFNDFVDCVSKHGTAVQMNVDDFYDLRNEHGMGKDTNSPLLKDVVEVQFKIGSTKLF